MSVVTTADERISSAKEHVKAAAKDLADVVLEECWGHDDFHDKYRSELALALSKLVDIKGTL